MLSEENLKNLARSCRLALTDEELARYRDDLEALTRLSEPLLVLPSSLENTIGKAEPDSLRDDEIGSCLAREVLLQNAPQARDGYFVVPRTVEEGDA